MPRPPLLLEDVRLRAGLQAVDRVCLAPCRSWCSRARRPPPRPGIRRGRWCGRSAVWVLITIVTGLLVTVLTSSSSGWPQPGSFVSTTTAPVAVRKSAVLPPPPLSTYSVSATLSTVTVLGACAAGACDAAIAIDPIPAAASAVSTHARIVMLLSQCRAGTARAPAFYPVGRPVGGTCRAIARPPVSGTMRAAGATRRRGWRNPAPAARGSNPRRRRRETARRASCWRRPGAAGARPR